MNKQKNIYLIKLYFCLLFISFSIGIKKIPFLLTKKFSNKTYNNSTLFMNNNLFFHLNNYKIICSYNYNLIKICYKIQIFDSSFNNISPSNLTLHHNLHIFCLLNINNTFNLLNSTITYKKKILKKNINVIYSFAIIEEDKYFKCIEFSYFNESIKIGFVIYETTNNNTIKNNYKSFSIDINIHNLLFVNNDIFNSSIINYEYNYFFSHLQRNKSSSKSFRLKKLYISKPFFTLKRNFTNKENQWTFANIFNEYFCFCKGFNCIKSMISRNCKYFFYLYLIDINKDIYNKTDFLLLDFISKNFSSDDVFPIFERMIYRNINAHYLTEKEDIYEKYCKDIINCDIVIKANKCNCIINDDFLEKYFTLVLKLKQVISSIGVEINFINNIFYNIDYITYISIGHGISYFKYYLYRSYYAPHIFDKILIPNSKRLISMAIKNGWKDDHIIKLSLPRWEKYNTFNKSLNNKGKIKSNSIFIMFTWREHAIGKNISSYYINNILNLINNKKLINILLNHNLTVYFTLHHAILRYKNKFKIDNHIEYVEEKNIAECLLKTDLVVTDYSSIIFDMIYRRKPYIIYIPDLKELMINTSYNLNTYNIIKNFKNNYFRFETVFFDINSTINKINYYIDNEFALDEKLNIFYNEFNFNNVSIINNFIDYILK